MKPFSRIIENTSSNESRFCLPDFKLINLAYINASGQPTWEFPLHAHQKGVEISIVVGGKGILYFGGMMYEMEKDDVIIKNEGVLHAESSDHNEPLEQICLLFDGLENKCGVRNQLLPQQTSPIININSVSVVRSLAFHIRHLCNKRDETMALNQLCRALAEIICSEIPDIVMEPIDANDYFTIKNMQKYIDEHYCDRLTLKGLSQLFYIDQYYFAHRFKEVTGFSFRQYIINRRMGEAEKMLIFEDRPIEEISRLVGYESLQYFYQSFRKCVGCTPGEFKNRYK